MNILVYGFYDKKNIGDELFKDSFRTLFPQYNFTFTDKITDQLLSTADAVFFGGGSILYGDPGIGNHIFITLKTKPIFYIGVGGETAIHPTHLDLMKSAKLIAIRNAEFLDKIKKINANTIVIPDLVYALNNSFTQAPKLNKSVLVIPNAFVVPCWNDEQWKHASWNYFKSEFAQALDTLVDHSYLLNFFPMCSNERTNDSNLIGELISAMQHKRNYAFPNVTSFNQIMEFFSQYELIISQRYHGIVLAEMLNIPYISIFHDEKLTDYFYNRGKFVSYYGFNKGTLLNEIHNLSPFQSVSFDMFNDLKTAVSTLL